VPISDGQSQQLEVGQCGYIPLHANPWTGEYYHNYNDVTEETYGANYYLQIVKAITPSQPNPTTWTADATKGFDGGLCTTTVVKSENYDTWIQWVDCNNVTPIEPEEPTESISWTNNCSVDVIGTSNDRSRTQTRTYTEPATNAELTNFVDDALSTWDNAVNVGSNAFFYADFTQVDGVDSEFYSEVYINKSRYRYRVPEGTNTYMKYVIEETFTPADHDPQDPEASPIVVVEKTLEWLGGITVDEVFIPATPGDDDTWATEWQTLECSAPGIKTRELIKYRCYTGGAWVLT